MTKVYLKGVNASDGAPRIQEMRVTSYDDLHGLNHFARERAVAKLIAKAEGFKGAICVLTHQPERGEALAWEQCGWLYTVEKAKEKLKEPAYHRATYTIKGETKHWYAPREQLTDSWFLMMAADHARSDAEELGVDRADVGVRVDYVAKPE